MKGQELKDFVKANHTDFGGSMSNSEIAKQAEVSQPRISQIKKKLKEEISGVSQGVSLDAGASTAEPVNA